MNNPNIINPFGRNLDNWLNILTIHNISVIEPSLILNIDYSFLKDSNTVIKDNVEMVVDLNTYSKFHLSIFENNLNAFKRYINLINMFGVSISKDHNYDNVTIFDPGFVPNILFNDDTFFKDYLYCKIHPDFKHCFFNLFLSLIETLLDSSINSLNHKGITLNG